MIVNLLQIRMKIFIQLVLFCTLINFSFGQDFTLISKVDKDSISIKWIPANFESFVKMTKGVKIFRVESNIEKDFEQIDFSQSKIWEISPTEARFNQLSSSNPVEDKQIVLLEPFILGDIHEDAKNFAFGTAIIENIINPNFQFIVGNIFVDKDDHKKKTYVYKIEIYDSKPLFIKVNASKKTNYSSISDFKLSLDKRKTVNIEWSYSLYEKEALGYDIEHSIDKKKGGDNLLDSPYLPFKSDSEIDDKNALIRDKAEPGHFHFYRVIGRDAFGQKALFSEWEKIYVPLLINAQVYIDTIYRNKKERIINGTVYSSAKKNNIDEIHLQRSVSRNKDFHTIESNKFNDSVLNYKIIEDKTGDRYYYRLISINKDDTVSSIPYYFFTLDQEPPSPPTSLNGTIDSNGVVSLNWLPSEDKDIRGYKIYRANTKKEEFVEKTTFLSLNLSFKDTISLNNLTSEIYYYAQSVDSNFNQSITSDTILVIKPDTIPPIPCIISDVKMEKTKLIIEWVNSDSKDFYQSKLIRKGINSIDTIYTWKDTSNLYIDTNIVPEKNYSYNILTFDEVGNTSNSNEINRYFEPGFRKPIRNFKAKTVQNKKVILLSWDRPKDDLFSYKIYRAKLDGKLLPLKTIRDVNQLSFEDKNVMINNKYTYSIKYVNQEGIHSIPVKVEIIYQ